MVVSGVFVSAVDAGGGGVTSINSTLSLDFLILINTNIFFCLFKK